jgi:hypothetical protein
MPRQTLIPIEIKRENGTLAITVARVYSLVMQVTYADFQQD